jgi:hypothetical protein
VLNFNRNRKPPEVARMLWMPAQAILLLLLTLAVPRAHAAAMLATESCATSGNSFYCRLVGILHILYAVAAVLGVVLVVIAVFAYAAYRRNQKRRLDETRRP